MPNKQPPVEHRFSSTNQPAKNGQKPDKLKKFIKDNGLSSADITATIKHILPMTEREIKTLGEDKDAPILMRLFVSAIANDIETGTVANLMKLFDRAFGAPKQEVELSGKKDKPLKMVMIREIMGEGK